MLAVGAGEVVSRGEKAHCPIFKFMANKAKTFGSNVPPRPCRAFTCSLTLRRTKVRGFGIVPCASIVPPRVEKGLISVAPRVGSGFPCLPFHPSLGSRFRRKTVLRMVVTNRNTGCTRRGTVTAKINVI